MVSPGNRYEPLADVVEETLESKGHPPGTERVRVGAIDAQHVSETIGVRRKIIVDSGARASV